MRIESMKKILLVLAFTVTGLLPAQTAKEIISKNIELSGGLTNWKLLNTIILTGKVTLGLNEEYPVKILQARPNLSKTLITVNKKETAVEGYDGKKYYAMNYAANKLQAYPEYAAESFDNDFIDWENKGFEAKYLGKEKVNETYCHKVELIKNVNRTLYYFDTKNYMLLKEVNADETIVYGDYRLVGKLQMPFRIESSSAKKDSDFVITLNKIEINKEFPANTFKFQ